MTDVIWIPELRRFVAVGGYSSVFSSAAVIYSGDGITWTRVNSGGSDSLLSIDWSPTLGRMVATGLDGYGAYSSDGITWTGITGVVAGVDDANKVVWAGAPENRFVAAGTGGEGRYSATGNASLWTLGGSGTGALALGLAYSPTLDRFVLSDNFGQFRYCSDFASWTVIATTPFTAASETARSVRWIPQLALFVAVGGSGVIATSPDGITWTRRGTGLSSQPLYDVKWSSALGKLVAVGYEVLTSSDGVTWAWAAGSSGYVRNGIA